MQTIERRCTCGMVFCYLCQLDRVDSEARGVPLNLARPEEWEVVACYDGETEEVVETGLDRRDAEIAAGVRNHDGHAGVTYGVRRVTWQLCAGGGG